MSRLALVWTCITLLLLPSPHGSAAEKPRIPEQVSSREWESDIARFEAHDAAKPPPQGAVLFIGSSSIRFWDSLKRDFPDETIVKRGFGGSQIRDATWYADRIVLPYHPRMVILYAGDNDLAAGRSPEQVRTDFLAFVRRIHRSLPRTRIAFIAIKPSPSRAPLLPAIERANALVRASARWHRRVDFIDVYTPMLNAQGRPRPELFRKDELHMNQAGYALWRHLVAGELSRH